MDRNEKMKKRNEKSKQASKQAKMNEYEGTYKYLVQYFAM